MAGGKGGLIPVRIFGKAKYLIGDGLVINDIL
jgi:hypothetical protein